MVTKDKLNIKIIDFGSCSDLDGTPFEEHFERQRNEEKRKRPHFKYFVGTPNYMPPECVRNKETNESSDVWSLGCLLHNLYIGFSPFTGRSEYLIFKKSLKLLYNKEEQVIPKEALEIIEACLQIEQKDRITMDELLKKNYFKNVSLNRIEFPRLREVAWKKWVKQQVDKVKEVKKIAKENEEAKAKMEGELKEEEKEQIKETERKFEEARKQFEEEFIEASDKLVTRVEEKQLYRAKCDLLKRQIEHECFGITFEVVDDDPELLT